MANIRVLETDELFEAAAELFAESAERSIKERDRFCVALSGGTTPIRLYEKLATGDHLSKVDLSKVFFFFGDERDVSPESERSNFKLARSLLFKPLKISAANVVRWPTEIIDAVEVAAKYEQSIRRFFELSESEFPRFDLIFLGLGDDCHTASLFPGTAALAEQKRIAVCNRVEKLDTNRLTLTFPAINNARRIAFLITGDSKSRALGDALDTAGNCSRFPAQCIRPVEGTLDWLVDRAAGASVAAKKGR